MTARSASDGFSNTLDQPTGRTTGRKRFPIAVFCVILLLWSMFLVWQTMILYLENRVLIFVIFSAILYE